METELLSGYDSLSSDSEDTSSDSGVDLVSSSPR